MLNLAFGFMLTSVNLRKFKEVFMSLVVRNLMASENGIDMENGIYMVNVLCAPFFSFFLYFFSFYFFVMDFFKFINQNLARRHGLQR